ncbi:MAG: hypothetical protein Ct9H90mP8_3830 [Pseudomonadota bacterium]|nr:MAG: hypothetical protein Ct9H90mP8_3830 [Pseudomonadota bacterium]
MDQAKILKHYDFPTVMILPTRDMTTSIGIANGIRRFVDYFGKPVVLYIKNDGYMGINEAHFDGGRIIIFYKIAIVRKDLRKILFLKNW